jgi:two-component system sensor histidine kinase TtrS
MPDRRRNFDMPCRDCVRSTFFTRALALLGLALALLGAPGDSAASPSRPPVRIATLAYQGVEDSGEQWSELLTYLGRALPDYRFELLHLDLSQLREAVRESRAEFVLTNSGQYVALEAEFGLSRIVTVSHSQAPSPDRALGSAVIARAERDDLRSLADLKNKTIAAVAPDAFGGYLIALRELVRRGVDPDKHDVRVTFLGLPMQRIVDAVERGDVDGGIVRACLLEALAARERLDLSRFKVLSPVSADAFPCRLSTALYPDWPLAKARHTDLGLAKAVATALLSMPPTTEGLSWHVPADYQAVHELYRELRIGPYSYLREESVQRLARRYWPYVLVAFIALTAVVIHLVRVEHLVKRRTSELSLALAARERAENRMRSQQEEAQHLSRLSILGELSGTLAHELNQPLTTIGTYAQSMERRFASGNVDAATFSHVNREIAQQAQRAGAIIQRIRSFARKRAAVREARNLQELVDEAAALFADTMPSVPRVVVENRAGSETVVRADPLQIQEVLLNLMKNAADASSGLPSNRRAISVRLEREGPWLSVAVTDRGAGIPETVKEKLFEPFFTTKHDGLGLGLSICKTIIEAHGGRIWGEANATGSGSTFGFRLPAEARHVS